MTSTLLVGGVREQTEFSTVHDYRRLVSPITFERLAARIVQDEGLTPDVAEQIAEGAIGFLYLLATNPDNGFAPSKLVDIGWHTFILYTRDYAGFCERVAGRFIHHEPNDNPERSKRRGGISRSIETMIALGLPFNELLWTGNITRRKVVELVSASALTSDDRNDADCDDGGGGPGDECTCS
jgi:hypothetical protein